MTFRPFNRAAKTARAPMGLMYAADNRAQGTGGSFELAAANRRVRPPRRRPTDLLIFQVAVAAPIQS